MPNRFRLAIPATSPAAFNRARSHPQHALWSEAPRSKWHLQFRRAAPASVVKWRTGRASPTELG